MRVHNQFLKHLLSLLPSVEFRAQQTNLLSRSQFPDSGHFPTFKTICLDHDGSCLVHAPNLAPWSGVDLQCRVSLEAVVLVKASALSSTRLVVRNVKRQRRRHPAVVTKAPPTYVTQNVPEHAQNSYTSQNTHTRIINSRSYPKKKELPTGSRPMKMLQVSPCTQH